VVQSTNQRSPQHTKEKLNSGTGNYELIQASVRYKQPTNMDEVYLTASLKAYLSNPGTNTEL